MRWVRVKFDAWGAFEGTELVLDPATPGFHLIHGANEAGKSTAMRGLRALLYGIPARTTDAFKHTYAELRLSAEIEKADGTQGAFSRRKGTKNTLTDSDGAGLPESALEAFLGGVSAEVYDRVYSMDHPSLIDGGKALASGGGSAQEILFQAGAGMTHLRRVMRGLDDEAGALYKDTGKKSVVNRALDLGKAASKRVTELSVRPTEWAGMEKQRLALAGKRDALIAALKELDDRRRELEQIRQAIPLVGDWAGRKGELTALGEVVLLDEGAREARLKIEQEEVQVRLERETARSRLKSIEDDLKAMPVSEALLASAATVRRLVEQLDRYRSAVEEIPQRQAEAKQHERKALALLAELHPGLSLEEAASFRLSADERTEIERLVQEAAFHDQAKTTLDARRAKLSKQEKELSGTAENEPEGATDDVTAEALRLIVQRLDRKGDLEGEIRKQEAELKSRESELERAMDRLGRWKGDWEALVRLRLPAVEVVAEFEDRFAEADQKGRDLKAREAALHEDRSRAEAGIVELEKSSAAPTEADLTSGRDLRDRQWTSLKTRSEKGEAWPKAAATDYERAVTEADAVADRLRREARQVEKRAALEELQRRCGEDLGRLEKELQEVESARAHLEKEWAGLWSGIGVEAAAPKVMRGWMATFGEIRREAEAWFKAKDLAEILRSDLNGGRKELMAALQGIEVSFSEGAAFSDLMTLARQHLKEEETRAKERVERAAARRRLTQELEDLTEESVALEAKETNWQKAWSTAVGRLEMGEQPPVRKVQQALERWTQFWTEVDQGRGAQSAVEDLQSVIHAFESNADALREQASAEEKGLPAEALVSRMEVRVRQTESDLRQRQLWEKRALEEKKHAEEADEAVIAMTVKLRGLMDKAGSDDRDGLLRAEEASSRHRELSREVARIESELKRLHPTGTLAEFAKTVQAWEEVSAEQSIKEVATEAQVRSDERVAIERELAVIETQMKERDGSDAAAMAREEVEFLMAEAEEGAERHAQLRLAEFFLRRHLDHYMEKNQGPVLRAGSEIFQRLTLGRYEKIVPDFDEKDEPILKAGLAGGKSIGVEGLSDGTRDQMFLALRLASMEQRLDGGQVFPLIVDDLLLTFDNERAGAALQELSRIARKTQVLFFTHHAHLIRLTEESLKPREFRVQELG